MLRMEFYRLTHCLKLRMEGRFVLDFAEHARMLIGDSTLPSKVIVDLSEVNYVDAVGEEVLLWFKEIGVTFTAESAYSHDRPGRNGTGLRTQIQQGAITPHFEED